VIQFSDWMIVIQFSDWMIVIQFSDWMIVIQLSDWMIVMYKFNNNLLKRFIMSVRIDKLVQQNLSTRSKQQISGCFLFPKTTNLSKVSHNVS
jgi:hypothetical protein